MKHEEPTANAKKSGVRARFKRLGRVKSWIIGVGAVASALTAVFALVFMWVPGLKPLEPSLEGWATLSISRVEHNVTFGEYLQRPWVLGEGAVESDEQLEIAGNVVYFDVETQGFAKKRAYARYTVYDTDAEKPISGLTFRRAWPSEEIIPSSQTSKAQLETWIPVPQDGSSGPYMVWIELYTYINEQERRLASDEEKV
jgi:hypothetical protein